MPQASHCSVNVVLLAGSFNARFISDIQAKAAAETLQKDPTSNNIRRTKEGVEFVPPGLQSVSNTGGCGESLAAVIAHLLAVHQCNPITQSLYMVTNAANHEDYTGTAAFFDTIGRFDKDWQQKRVICNGASRPAEWQGPVADLQLALEHIAQDNTMDTIVLDANLFFWPTFNLQKLASNMIIRGELSVALQPLTATDLKLYQPHDLTATASPSEPGQAPLLAPLNPTPTTLAEGQYATRACAYVPAAAAGTVRAAPCADVPTLTHLMAWLQAPLRACRVYGAIMPPGCYDLTSLLPQRYVQQCMLFNAATRRRLVAHTTATEREVDTVNTMLQCLETRSVGTQVQECDDTGLGRSKIMDEGRVTELLGHRLAESAEEFDRHFFAMEASKFCGYQRPAYKLPATFYMSSYRTSTTQATV